MKWLPLLLVLLCSQAWADVTAEIKDVTQDPIHGSIIVQTEYKVNGERVVSNYPHGNWVTRYDDGTGGNAEIIAKAKEDIKAHCDALCERIPANSAFIKTERLKRQKEMTQPIINSIRTSLVGHTESTYEVTDEFKGKNIKVTTDGKNTVSDAIIVR